MDARDTVAGPREQPDAGSGPSHAPPDTVLAQVTAEFEHYRATSAAIAPFDACGGHTDGYYDELVDGAGRVRSMWSELSADFIEQGPAGLLRIDGRVRRLIDDDGITYTATDAAPAPSRAPVHPLPWRLDPIPLLVSVSDWALLEAGLVQRSRLLDAVLTDIYGRRRILTSGLLPPEVVFGCAGYVRAAHGVTVPGRHQLFLHGCDISRWSDGEFRVLADWAQAPSGAGYALADRRVVSAAIPEAFESASPRPLTPFARAMRLMLIEAAPGGIDDPVVVVLSPGVHSETAFDREAYLASVLGFPLVESADLVVRDGMLWMRSLGTLRRVDVVLRRVDAEFTDPLDLRPDSQLGVVGLVEVLRRGAVTVVNTLGSGLLESPALAAFLPRMCWEILGEELKLPGAPSYWGGDPVERGYLLANLDRLIIRSAVDGSVRFGPALSAAEREELRARICDRGWQWVGQDPPQFSVAPAVAGSLAPAAGGAVALTAGPVGVRLFSLAGRVGYRAMPGGLGQLHQRLHPDRSVITVAAKDIWVRAAPPTAVAAVSAEPGSEDRVRPASIAPALEAISSPRMLDALFWLGRYAERAEAAVRLLVATHAEFQDYRYRPWLEGADAVPVLMAALGRVTGTPVPLAGPSGSPPPPPGAGQPDLARSETVRSAPEDRAPDLPPTQQQQSQVDSRAFDPSRGGTRPPQRAPEAPAAHRQPPRDGGNEPESEGVDQPPESDVVAPPLESSAAALPTELSAAALSPDPAPPDPTAAAPPLGVDTNTPPPQPVSPIPAVGATPAGHAYLVRVTTDRELPGSLAHTLEYYGANARAVRDQLSSDTWMAVSAMDRALAGYQPEARDQESELSAVLSATLAALLSLAGMDAESMVRDTGWYVTDIGKRIERALALTALLSAALTRSYPEAVERTVTEAVLRATESAVSYRRRHRDSVRISAVASLLLFDAANPRSLAYQLDRLQTDLQALPGASGASRPQLLLAEAQRVLRRLDPADLESTDSDGRRTEFAELLDGVHGRIRTLAEAFAASRLAGPGATQPLWGATRVVA